MADIIIRNYKKEDRQAVRDIAWETAFMGESASVFFSDREIFSDFLTSYFTDCEPESCFVAEAHCEIIGYLIGAKNESLLRKTVIFKIMPKLIIKAVFRNALLKKKNLIYLSYCLMSFLKGEFRDPDFTAGYPALLHINLGRRFRGLGIGSKLIFAFSEYIARQKIKGIHLSTMSGRAEGFFKSNGFTLLYSAARPYFKYMTHEDTAVYIYGKKMVIQ